VRGAAGAGGEWRVEGAGAGDVFGGWEFERAVEEEFGRCVCVEEEGSGGDGGEVEGVGGVSGGVGGDIGDEGKAVRNFWGGFWSALLSRRQVADKTNLPLVRAFPSEIQEDVKVAVARLPRDAHSFRIRRYSVKVGDEILSIPKRVYHDISKIHLGSLSPLQMEILNCILSRHVDGFVRQSSLERVLGSNNIWIPAFVVQLAGEYVVEILALIERNMASFDHGIYSEFLVNNPAFLELTAQRIKSYWDCYYREINRNEYAGFRILRNLQNLASKKTHQIC